MLLNYSLEVSSLLANRVVADVVMGLGELVSIEVAVEHNKGMPTDTIVAVVGPCIIVVATLVPEIDPVNIADFYANRVAADVVMAVVEHSTGKPTDTSSAVVGPSTKTWLLSLS